MTFPTNTGVNSRTNSIDSPVLRNAFGTETLTLDDTEVFYLRTAGAITDSIPRTFLVTAKSGVDPASATNFQAAIVHIWRDQVLLGLLLSGGAAMISIASDETTGTAGDVTLGYDSSTTNYFIRNDVGDDVVVTLTRLDGMTEDLVASSTSTP